jgi:DNA-binding NarL/FixJ family response regulator
VEQRAHAYNDFPTPLPHNEVQHTAKSVARYTHRNFSPAGFSAWQAAQGAKGGRAKGQALRDQLLPVVAELLEAGFSQADIAREVEQSRQTVSNWVRALKSGSVKKLSK